MSQSTMLYVLSHIFQEIPRQMLELAFKPSKYNTTIEQRIISEVIEGPILLDTNLVGGKPRTITISANWRMNLRHVETFGIMGGGLEGAYYMVPDFARENRNISSVLGISAFTGGSYTGAGVGFSTTGHRGNTGNNLLSEMVASHTLSNSPVIPQVSLEGSNIIRFFPELLTDGLAVRVMLEHDAEFLNLNKAAIYAMRKLCLCAVQRYIVKELIVPVDETEVVAGMEIGVIKTLIQDYQQKAEQYDALLIKMKGAMHSDPASITRLMWYAV